MAKWFVVYEKWDNDKQRYIRYNDVKDADLSDCCTEYFVWEDLGFTSNDLKRGSFAIVSLTKIGE